MVKVFSYCLQIHSASIVAGQENKKSPDELIKVFTIAVNQKFIVDEKEFKNMEELMEKHKAHISFEGK